MSVVVTPAANRASHHPENLEDDADNDQEKADAAERRPVGEERNDNEEYAYSNHKVKDLPSHTR